MLPLHEKHDDMTSRQEGQDLSASCAVNSSIASLPLVNNTILEGNVDMERTSGWTGRPNGRHDRMEGTSGWKRRVDERDVRMEGTSEWKRRLDKRDVRMKGTPH
ncbi:hypothetical protein Tco_0486970 [Tanacetum coccineum]